VRRQNVYTTWHKISCVNTVFVSRAAKLRKQNIFVYKIHTAACTLHRVRYGNKVVDKRSMNRRNGVSHTLLIKTHAKVSLHNS